MTTAKKSVSPKISAPRSVKRQNAQKKIFDAAMQLMRDYGYDYVTVGNVCEVAGISTGNFYHYFESKDELIAQFFIVSYEQFLESHPENSDADPIEDIVAFFCSYSQFCQDQGIDLVRNFYTPLNSALDMSKGSAEGSFELPSLRRAERQISDAQDRGFFTKEASAHQVAKDICTIEKAVIFDWCISGGSFDVAPEVHRLLTQYLKSYKNE